MPRTHMDMPYFAMVYAENKRKQGVKWHLITEHEGWQLVATVTCVVFEPDGVKVERRGQVEDVRVSALQQVRDDQLRPDR